MDKSLRLPTGKHLAAACANRRFRWLILIPVTLVFGVEYFYHEVLPWLTTSGRHVTDLTIYMGAAQTLQAGLDPYSHYIAHPPPDAAMNSSYIYPPILAWFLQPLLGLEIHQRDLVVLLILHLLLLVFLMAMCIALSVKDPQEILLFLLLVITFDPWRENVNLFQVNILLLTLTSIWLAGQAHGRKWPALALGAAVAIKLFQAPLVLYLFIRRQWKAGLLAILGILVLSLLAFPKVLLEYFLIVVPNQAGTGDLENSAPLGLITRTMNPDTLIGVGGTPTLARGLAALIALIIIAISAHSLLAYRREGVQAFLLETSLVLAATPLVVTLQWSTHLVMLLIPLLVLIHYGLRNSDRIPLVLGVACWCLFNLGLGSMHVLALSGLLSRSQLLPLGWIGPIAIFSLWLTLLYVLRRLDAQQISSTVHPHPT